MVSGSHPHIPILWSEYSCPLAYSECAAIWVATTTLSSLRANTARPYLAISTTRSWSPDGKLVYCPTKRTLNSSIHVPWLALIIEPILLHIQKDILEPHTQAGVSMHLSCDQTQKGMSDGSCR